MKEKEIDKELELIMREWNEVRYVPQLAALLNRLYCKLEVDIIKRCKKDVSETGA